MNGGRLSNDEAFLIGLGELRAQFTSPACDHDAVSRAIVRVAIRFPEEAGQLTELWQAGRVPDCQTLLDQVEQQHRSEFED